jgi:hypothetical protein
MPYVPSGSNRNKPTNYIDINFSGWFLCFDERKHGTLHYNLMKLEPGLSRERDHVADVSILSGDHAFGGFRTDAVGAVLQHRPSSDMACSFGTLC